MKFTSAYGILSLVNSKLAALAATVALSLAFHHSPALANKAKADPAYQRFVSACSNAFKKSFDISGNEDFGLNVCKCTSEESKPQGVSINTLKKETAAIEKDPHYQIKDKGLLGAFQYCTMKEMDPEHPPVPADRSDK